MLRFRKGTSRNTEAYVIRVGEASFYVSYETIVAASGWTDDGTYRAKRLENSWGTTTGRHINEMGVRMYEITEDEEFSRFVDDLIINAVKSKIVSNFKENNHG